MTFLDSLKALFDAEPIPAQVASFPDESEPGYWDDKSNVGIVYEAPEGAMLDTWRPTADQVVPGYRGTEEHGVPYDAAQNYIVPNMEALNAPAEDNSTSDTVEYEERVPLDPIPVNVVSLPSPVGVEKRLATNQYTVTKDPAVAGGTPPITQIAPQSHTRELLWITVAGTDVIQIGRDPQTARVNGFQVRAGLGNFPMDTTDAIYAYCPNSAPQDATVYVMETVKVSVNESAE